MKKAAENFDTLSLEDAVGRLKAEILAHDWSLNQRRIRFLETAFAAIAEEYSERKVQLVILTMAANTLAYIKKNSDNFHAAALDFLKEAMAKVVQIHESEHDNGAEDEKIFSEIYNRFQFLKNKIAAG